MQLTEGEVQDKDPFKTRRIIDTKSKLVNHISMIIRQKQDQIQEFEGLYDIIKQKTMTVKQPQIQEGSKDSNFST